MIMANENLGVAAISGGSSLVGGLLGQAFYKKNAKYQAELQKQLSAYQADLERQNYDYQMNDQRNFNEYANMLRKYEEAGISPLAGDFSGSTGDASLSSGSASLGTPYVPSFDFGKAVDVALAKQKLAIEQQNADTNEKVGDSQARKNEAEAVVIELTTPDKCREAAANVDLLLSKKEMNEQEKKVLAKQEQLEDQKIKEIANNIVVSLSMRDLKAREIAVQESRNKWEKEQGEEKLGILKFDSRTSRMNANTAYGELKFRENSFQKEFNLSKERTIRELRQGDIGKIIDLLETNKVKVLGSSLGASVSARLCGILDGISDAFGLDISQARNTNRLFELLLDYQQMLNPEVPVVDVSSSGGIR